MIDNLQDFIAAMQKPCPDTLSRKQIIKNHRSAYAGARGGYFITFNGGEVKGSIIDLALQRGLIEPEWPDKPNLEYWKLK